MDKYIWEKFDNPKATELRKTYKLDDIFSIGSTELEKQLLLKDWVFSKLPLGNPSKDYSKLSAFEILEDQKKGLSFYCTQFAQLFIQSSIALNWYSRKLSIDIDHNENKKSMHHGICDIWSNELEKWYMIDPMHNLHFELEGKPLNALEIRAEYLKNKGVNLVGVIGNHDNVKKYSENSLGFDTPSNYFWFYVSQRNNYFEKPGLFDTRTYLFIDKNNKNKTWYKDGQKHPMYNSQFIKSSDASLIFPTIK